MSESMHVVCPHCNSVNRLPGDKLGAGGKCGKCRKPLFEGRPAVLTSAHFNNHIVRSDIPIVVDFWAPWCGPCKMMAPIFEQAASQLEPQVRLAKVNTEQEQELATQHAIRSIPTLAIFRGGKEVTRVAGAMELGNLLSWVRQNI